MVYSTIDSLLKKVGFEMAKVISWTPYARE
jgi:hypothetical protein